MEIFDDLSWIKDYEPKLFMRGTRIFIGDDETNKNHDIKSIIQKGEYLILEITSMDNKEIYYNVFPVSIGKNINSQSTSLSNGKELLKDSYWRILNPNTPNYLFMDDNSITPNDFTPYLVSFYNNVVF